MRPLLGLFTLALVGCEIDAPTTEREDTEAVCYDGADNDDNGFEDCEDPGCTGLPTCCIGRSTADCCAAPAPVFDVSFAACADATGLDGCTDALEPLGSTVPAVVDGAIAGGAGPTDHGVYLATPLDPQGSRLSITFEAATATACDGACLNFVAVGLSRDVTTPVPQAVLQPLAVAIRPGRGDGALFSYGDTIATFAVAPGYHTYRLDVSPEGSDLYEVDAAGTVLASLVEGAYGVDPDPAWLTVMARTEDLPEGALPARVRSVQVSRGACDRPQRSAAEDEPLIPRPGTDDASALGRIEGVGRAVNGAGDELVLVDAGDAFHAWVPDGAGGYAPAGDLATPRLALADFPGATGIDDPWLVADDAAGVWLLYFTYRTGPNDSGIGRIASAPGFGGSFDVDTFRLVAEGDDGFPKLEQPTVLGDRMIARAANIDLGVFVQLRPDGPDRWTAPGPDLADGEIHRPHFVQLSAMDRDEIADPALVELGGVLRLYFAGRRGTRWFVGTLASVGGDDWHQPLGLDPIWDLEATGFADLQAYDPTPWIEDGLVRMLYVGEDGALQPAVGRAYSGTTATWP